MRRYLKNKILIFTLGLGLFVFFLLASPRGPLFPYGKYVYGKFAYGIRTDGGGGNDEDDNDKLDSDGDGLTDKKEIELGLDPFKKDTDEDGIDDGQEVLDGTNPLDKGSKARYLPTSMCTEWNGFLDGMWNILEHVNLSVLSLKVSDQLYSISGEALGRTNFEISAGLQLDTLVHDFEGYKRDTYGKLCITHSGGEGDLDGRMMYYKTEPGYPHSSDKFQFALALDLSPGNRGPQYILYNTYQPSMLPSDSENLVANWIQLTNLGNAPISGSLKQYAFDGSLIKTEAINLGVGERRDVAAHEVGKNLVGLIEWLPNSNSTYVQVRNIRYLYDNSEVRNSFDTAFQLEGAYGTGEKVSVPFDNSQSKMGVLEVSNVLDKEVGCRITFVSEGITKQFDISLSPHASQHFITNSIFPGQSKGIAIVDGVERSSILAVMMQYGYLSNSKIAYMYGLIAKEPTGEALKGSYNTFLDQESRVVIVNQSSISRQGNIRATRRDGSKVLFNNSEFLEFSVPALSFIEIPLRAHAGADNYGVVTIVPEVKNSISGLVLRTRRDEFVIPSNLSR